MLEFFRRRRRDRHFEEGYGAAMSKMRCKPHVVTLEAEWKGVTLLRYHLEFDGVSVLRWRDARSGQVFYAENGTFTFVLPDEAASLQTVKLPIEDYLGGELEGVEIDPSELS